MYNVLLIWHIINYYSVVPIAILHMDVGHQYNYNNKPYTYEYYLLCKCISIIIFYIIWISINTLHNIIIIYYIFLYTYIRTILYFILNISIIVTTVLGKYIYLCYTY